MKPDAFPTGSPLKYRTKGPRPAGFAETTVLHEKGKEASVAFERSKPES